MGQAATSPFASYGLGEQFGTGLTQNLGMGGTGIANGNYWYVNNMNPALLIYNRFTAFQAGIIGEQRTQISESLTEKSGSGNLNSLVLAIPIKPGKWTTSVALMPYTRLNYRLKYTVPVPGSSNSVAVAETGTGGVNQLTLSNGVSINKKFSLGLKAAYLFSGPEAVYANTLTTASVLVIPAVYERASVSDFQFSPAFLFHTDSVFGKKYNFNFGVVYDFKTNLSARFYQRLQRLNSAGRQIDSVTTINNKPTSISIPQSIAAGISFGKANKWTTAIEGSYSEYASYRALDGGNPYQGTSWRLAAGFELTPDQQSLSSYLKRATYRTGVSIENYPYLVNGNPVKDFGITFGLSLPVSRLSSIDVAVKVGKKGDKALNTIEENYLKLYFGITFIDQWFIKRRFD
ncbi:hypothetical protein BH10BAC4_BH10BAC4_04840 [soil metagenome]